MGSNGEFLLQLDEGFDSDSILQLRAFDLKTEDAVPEVRMQEYLDDTGREGPTLSILAEARATADHADCLDSTERDLTVAHLTPVPPSLLKSMDISIRQAANAMHRHIDEALWTSPSS